MGKGNDATHRAVQGFAALGFLVLVYLQILGGNPFPWSDEWGLIPPAIGARPLSWAWLWEQHVDHRLPLQKLFQVLLLRASILDFRILVLANSVLAYLVTRFLLAATRSYRGRSHAGDLLFPLILLNPGFTPFDWGFQLQFMSSVLLSLCMLALLLRDTTHGNASAPVLGAVCALLLAFCGMNGAIFSAVMSVGMGVYVWMAKPVGSDPAARATALSFALPTFAALVVFLSWTPSSVSGWNDGSWTRGIGDVLGILLYLTSARSWALPPVAPAVYFTVNSLVYLAAIGLLGRGFWRARRAGDPIGSGPFGLALIMLATVIVLTGVAIGRAKYWSPGLQLHYGYLATILPLASWIVISTQAGKKIALVAGLALVLMYAAMYEKNVGLKRQQFLQRRQDLVQLGSDLGSGMAVDAFVERNIRLLFYIDDEKSRRSVARTISMLRKAGVPPYVRLAP